VLVLRAQVCAKLRANVSIKHAARVGNRGRGVVGTRPGMSEDPPTLRAMTELTDRQQQLLAFERQWWKYAGAKETAIRDRFGLSATRYYQLLNALLDRPEALQHDPQLVMRLRRLREQRAARRAG
jgi:hypothetical protein